LSDVGQRKVAASVPSPFTCGVASVCFWSEQSACVAAKSVAVDPVKFFPDTVTCAPTGPRPVAGLTSVRLRGIGVGVAVEVGVGVGGVGVKGTTVPGGELWRAAYAA
jgi:hypothetical protein